MQGGVYAETVQKHKCSPCGNLLLFKPSFVCNPSACGLAPLMLNDGRRDVSYNRRPWKQFSIRFAWWK
jgi:hypothetical protein